MEVTNKVLNRDQTYQGSFKFWYLRALAECSSWQIKACEKSYLAASMFAEDKYLKNIDGLKSLLENFKPKNKFLES